MFRSLSQTPPWACPTALPHRYLPLQVAVLGVCNPAQGWGVLNRAVPLTLGVVKELLVVHVNTSPSG